MKNLFDITIRTEESVVLKAKQKTLKQIQEDLATLGAKYE